MRFFSFLLCFGAIASASPIRSADLGDDEAAKATESIHQTIADLNGVHRKLTATINTFSPSSDFSGLESGLQNLWNMFLSPTPWSIPLKNHPLSESEAQRLVVDVQAIEEQFKALTQILYAKRSSFSDNEADTIGMHLDIYRGKLDDLVDTLIGSSPKDEQATLSSLRNLVDVDLDSTISPFLHQTPVETVIKPIRPLLELLPELRELQEKLRLAAEKLGTEDYAIFSSLLKQTEGKMDIVDDSAFALTDANSTGLTVEASKNILELFTDNVQNFETVAKIIIAKKVHIGKMNYDDISYELRNTGLHFERTAHFLGLADPGQSGYDALTESLKVVRQSYEQAYPYGVIDADGTVEAAKPGDPE